MLKKKLFKRVKHNANFSLINDTFEDREMRRKIPCDSLMKIMKCNHR